MQGSLTQKQIEAATARAEREWKRHGEFIDLVNWSSVDLCAVVVGTAYGELRDRVLRELRSGE